VIGLVAAFAGTLLVQRHVLAFSAQKDPDDPFSEVNKLERKPEQLGKADAEKNKLTANPAPVVKGKNPAADNIEFTASVAPQSGKPGEVVKLTISGNIRPGYHTYPITQRTPDWLESGLSRIEFEPSADFKPIWRPFTESQPEFETEQDGSTVLVHRRPFTWAQDILIQPNAPPGRKPLRFSIKGQVCDDHGCVPLTYPLQVDIDVTQGPAVALSDIPARLEAKSPEIQVVSPPSEDEAADRDRSLASLLLVSMAAAIAMLFTPCVFPMIPITVSFFLKQAEKKTHNPLLTAAVYSATIIIVLAAAVLILGGVIVQLANDAWLNLGLGALLVFFALSLFGMYEIELPSALSRFTTVHEGKGGYLGAVFMALTFTITSFTCTGPFLGPLLVAVKEYQLSLTERALGALVYSATFAGPFFVLALFPSLLKALPKSGGWLNAVKVVMGFLELAAALKFLANTDLAWNPGRPMFFNYDSVLCAWIGLSVACGLYLFGIYRLPYDTPLENLGVFRMLLGTVFLGFAVYMAPALWRVTPQGIIGHGLVAFLPWDSKASQEELTWSRSYEEAWDLASREGKLIFIDFTGVNCTNCRANEKNVFVKPAVRKELEKYVRVQLYTDSVPDQTLSPAEASAQAARNSLWQSATFDDVTNPFYAIIRPQRGQPPLVAGSDGRSKLNGAQHQWTRKGFIPENKIRDFEQFLSEPLKRLPQTAQMEQGTSSVVVGEHGR
jgi:thiol:disulfide interchange protein DsbD